MAETSPQMSDPASASDDSREYHRTSSKTSHMDSPDAQYHKDTANSLNEPQTPELMPKNRPADGVTTANVATVTANNVDSNDGSPSDGLITFEAPQNLHNGSNKHIHEPEKDSVTNVSPEPEDLFKKKNVKPRTQSFQSVLSIASLKALNQQQQPTRQPSFAHSSNSKNFQSFIQAPVLSSITNHRTDEAEIGRHVPFVDTQKQEAKPEPVDEDTDDAYDDQDTILQQQKLTINALKKLSLSPLPIGGPEEKATKKKSNSKPKPEPYQPAEVDLSSFASLTRQPKLGARMKQEAPTLNKPNSTTVEPTVSIKLDTENKAPVSQNDAQLHNLTTQSSRTSLVNELNMKRKNASPINRTTPSLPTTINSQKPSPPANPANATAITTRNKQLKQIKGLRNPMYVPAVLRMTINSQHPNKSPSYYIDDDDKSPEDGARSLRSVDAAISLESAASSPHLNPVTPKNYEHYLRQPPTRKHWLKDESAYKCGVQTCPKQFNFFERRHHCRKCGGIFCKEHTSHYLYINHLAQFTTGGRGTLSRVCVDCINEYNEFIKSEFGLGLKKTPDHKLNEIHEDYGNFVLQGSNKSTVPRTSQRELYEGNTKEYPGGVNNKHINKPYLSQPEAAGSVPANWSWSSF